MQRKLVYLVDGPPRIPVVMEETMGNVETAKRVPEDLLKRLLSLYARGTITEEGLRLYLNNPDVIWANMDELGLARKIASRTTPQERAVCFGDIVTITCAEQDLQEIVMVRESGEGNPEVVLVALFYAYLAAGRPEQARALISEISDVGRCLDLLLRYIRNTAPEPAKHLEQPRAMLKALDAVQRVKYGSFIVQMSGDPADMRLVEEAFADLVAAEEPETRMAGIQLMRIRALLKLNWIEQARQAAAAIRIPEIRITDRCYIARHSKDPDDLAALMLDLRDTNVHVHTLRNIIGTLLALEQIEAARTCARTRKADEHCLLFSLIAVSEQGQETDLGEAKRAYGKAFRGGIIDASPVFALVRALLRWKQYSDAKALAMEIGMVLLRVRALLAIHQERTGKNPPVFGRPDEE